MGEIILTARHKRLLSSMLFVVEKKIDDIETILHKSSDHSSYRILHDIEDEKEKKILLALKNAKEKINEIVKKYGIRKREIMVSSYIPTIESQMWEMLTDSLSSSLKDMVKIL